MTDRLENIRDRLQRFARDRDWEQFHSPKNLTMALSAEVGELLEIFQWLTQAQSANLTEEQLLQVRRELADVQIYLLRLADVIGLDLIEAVESKMNENEKSTRPIWFGGAQKSTRSTELN